MRRLTISDFKEAILSEHRAHARVVAAETVSIHEDGGTPREQLVLVFELLDHPRARRCYAWEVDGHVVVVLHADSVDTPQAAVRSALTPNARIAEGDNAVSVTWSFRTSVGVLRIRPSSSRAGRFELCLDDALIRSYPSAEIASDDVCMAITGGPDGLDEVLQAEAPSALGEWTRHERER
jgi:hypothetical protein